MISENVRKFAENAVLPVATAIDRDDVFPKEVYAQLAELGLFGATLNEEAGGSGFDTVSLAIAMEELARCSGSVGNILAIPVEAVHLLYNSGNDRHKEFIPGILSGELIPATCVSEPEFGSDVASIVFTVTVSSNSEQKSESW